MQVVPPGSPPHTRGIHNLNGTGNTVLRITPAYAGNTALGSYDDLTT